MALDDILESLQTSQSITIYTYIAHHVKKFVRKAKIFQLVTSSHKVCNNNNNSLWFQFFFCLLCCRNLVDNLNMLFQRCNYNFSVKLDIVHPISRLLELTYSLRKEVVEGFGVFAGVSEGVAAAETAGVAAGLSAGVLAGVPAFEVIVSVDALLPTSGFASARPLSTSSRKMRP